MGYLPDIRGNIIHDAHTGAILDVAPATKDGTRSASQLGIDLVDLGYDVVTYTYPDSRHRPLEYQAYDLHRIVEWTKGRFVKKSVGADAREHGGLFDFVLFHPRCVVIVKLRNSPVKFPDLRKRQDAVHGHPTLAARAQNRI